jgi:hypothetical protein
VNKHLVSATQSRFDGLRFMSGTPFNGLLTLCLLLSCRLVMAAGTPPPANLTPAPPNPALNPPLSPFPGTVGPTDIGPSGSTPSLMALPAPSGTTNSSSTGPAIDSSNYRKFYTITAELRETYDDNVNTTNINKQTALETSISPSLLVDFPRANSDFSARYTFGATYYSYLGNNAQAINQSGSIGDNVQISNTFIAQFHHDFSERFSLTAAEQFLDSTEPNLFGSTGTPFRDGENISNTANVLLSAQWTPLFSTQTNYSNTLVHYDDSVIAETQDSLENTGSQTFSFSVLPKISLNFGGIVDDIAYDDVTRGYTNYTAFVGAQWQALPSVSVSGRGGASYTQTKEFFEGGEEQDSISPYAALSLSWQIGEKSTLSFDYSHEVTPTDQTGANGQQSDRLSANVSYAITSFLSSHLQAIYSYDEITNQLIGSPGLSAYNESDYALDTGVAYHFNKYFDVDFDITISGVSSELALRDYSRDEFSFGVRGTY